MDEEKDKSLSKALASVLQAFSILSMIHLFTFDPSKSNSSFLFRWLASAKLTAMFNAFLLSSLAFRSVIIRKDFERDQLFTYLHAHHWGFAFAAAFQIYDLLVSTTSVFADPITIIHHGLSFIGAMSMMKWQQTTFYPVWFFLSYATIVPTHLIWFLEQANADLALVNSMYFVRVLFYFIFRLFLGPLAIWRGYIKGDLSRWKNLHPVARVLCPLNVLTLSVLNVWWTVKVVQGFRRRLIKLKQ